MLRRTVVRVRGRRQSRAALSHGGDLFLGVVVRAVDDVHQEVRQLDRLQRGHEGVHEVVRQIRDEATVSVKEDGLTAGQLALTRAGIECDEQSVLGLHAGVGDGVQHRGLPALV